MFSFGTASTAVGVDSVSAFSMIVSGKSFNVLVSRLYSHKIRAVIREITCNAYDSHSKAGNTDKPVEVKLPTIIDPTFEVRDYGVSLTHEQIQNLYTTMFASSKETDESQTGCYGLGSKAPFAYANTFTVTAYLDGIKREYCAFLDGDQPPKIALMTSEPSDEPRGISVKVPVEMTDINTFMTEAQELYRAFAVTPKIINVPDFTLAEWVPQQIKARLFTIKTSAGEIHSYISTRHYYDKNTSNTNRAVIRMANVDYPLDIQQIDNPDLKSKIRRLMSDGVVIINSGNILDIPPSRECLEYTSKTKKNLVDVVLPNFFAELEKDLTANGIPATNFSEHIAAVQWAHDHINGKYITQYFKNIDPEEAQGLEISIARIQDYGSGQYETNPRYFDFLGCTYSYGVLSKHSKEEAKIYIHDTQSARLTIAKKTTDEYQKRYNSNRNRTRVESYALVLYKDSYLVYSSKYEKFFQKIAEDIEDLNVSVVFASDLEQIKKDKKTIRVFNQHDNHWDSISMDEIDSNKKYVLINRQQARNKGITVEEVHNINSVINHYIRSGVLTKNDIVIATTQLDYNTLKDWKNITEFKNLDISKLFKSVALTNEVFSRIINSSNTIRGHLYDINNDVAKIIYHNEPMVLQICNIINSKKKSTIVDIDILTLNKNHAFKLISDQNTEKYINFIRKNAAKFELIKSISRIQSSSPSQYKELVSLLGTNNEAQSQETQTENSQGNCTNDSTN